MSNKNFNSTYTLNLAADGTPSRQACSFTHLLVRTALYDFEMSLDGSSWFPMAQGEAFDLMPGTKLDEIFLRSSNNTAQAVTFRASSMMNSNSRLNIVSTGNAQLPVQVLEPQTKIKPQSFTLDAAGGANPSKIISAAASLTGRKSIKIFNLDAASAIYVANAAGQIGGVIWNQDSLELVTTADINIINSSAAPVNVLVMEIYYA